MLGRLDYFALGWQDFRGSSPCLPATPSLPDGRETPPAACLTNRIAQQSLTPHPSAKNVARKAPMGAVRVRYFSVRAETERALTDVVGAHQPQRPGPHRARPQDACQAIRSG